ncbi:MAG: hypothetical protein EBE86_018050 [Hormoscilla sp. GUM202]|nr:hypothetical protein [Hormoscilla sp. GUM202]
MHALRCSRNSFKLASVLGCQKDRHSQAIRPDTGELAQAERDWVIGHAQTYHPEMSKSQIDDLRNYNGTGTTDE